MPCLFAFLMCCNKTCNGGWILGKICDVLLQVAVCHVSLQEEMCCNDTENVAWNRNSRTSSIIVMCCVLLYSRERTS